MPWIEIDKTKCDNCGTCRTRCPSCYIESAGEIRPRGDDSKCIVCGHCLALCPKGAISHQKLDKGAFHPLPEYPSVDAEGFVALVKRRRSHRQFLDEPVKREHLEKLLELCRYAPTGFNTQAVEIKIIRDPERIAALSRAVVAHLVARIETLDDGAKALRQQGKEIPEAMAWDIERHARYRRMGRILDKGFDPIFFAAPCVMIFHASKKARTPKDDCVIAAHTATLGAIPLGLGSCYNALFTRATNESPDVLRDAGLPPGYRVYSTLILGYPKLKYLRTVERASIRTTWE